MYSRSTLWIHCIMSLQFIHPLPCVVMMTSFSAKVIFRIASVFTLMSQKDVASDQKPYKLRSLKNSILGLCNLNDYVPFSSPGHHYWCLKPCQDMGVSSMLIIRSGGNLCCSQITFVPLRNFASFAYNVHSAGWKFDSTALWNA